MAKDTFPKLHKRDDQLGELTVRPGTKAEYHQLRLQGWAEKKPGPARQTSTQTAKQSGDKK